MTPIAEFLARLQPVFARMDEEFARMRAAMVRLNLMHMSEQKQNLNTGEYSPAEDHVCSPACAATAQARDPVAPVQAGRYEAPKLTKLEVPDLVGTLWWRSMAVSEAAAIAGGHMLPDTFGSETRDLDGQYAAAIPRSLAMLEVVNQKLVPNAVDANYPRLHALLVDPRTGWRRVFVFQLLKNSDRLHPVCTGLHVGHDRNDPYALRLTDAGKIEQVCTACGYAPSPDGLCRRTDWRQRDELLMPVVITISGPPRPRLPAMDVVGGAGVGAMACGGLSLRAP
jgi:hypothetical protein